MTWAVLSKFFKNFVATVEVLGLYQACDAFLRGSLNSCSVPDICWSRQCVKRTAESATSEKARLNMDSQNAATKNINFSFAWLNLHNHTADKQAAEHTTAHSNVIRLPRNGKDLGGNQHDLFQSISTPLRGKQWESWVGITDNRSGIRTGTLPNMYVTIQPHRHFSK
jgi:hypothetical protein